MAFYDIIEGSYELMQEYADQAFTAALEFLAELGNLATSLNIPDVSYTWKPMPVIPGMKTAREPGDYTVTPVFPPPPSDFLPVTIIPPAIGAVPPYDVIKPSISFPARPPALDLGTIPVVPDTDTDFIYPEAPDYTFPDEPVLQTIIVPTMDPLDYPDWDATAPDDSFVQVPNNTFNFEEVAYDSALLDAVAADLQDSIVNGGTGFTPVVEQALWDRERNREDQAMLKAKAEVRDEFAGRGHILPPGVEFQKILEVSVLTQNKIISLGREIMIKAADLEQENIKHAISETIRLEGTLISNWNDQMQRKFNVAQYTQEIAIKIFEAQLGLYNARLQAYNIEATVYNTLIQAEMTKVEAYKAEVQAQALINEINKTTVEIYRTQVDTVKVIVDTYKAELDAVKTKLEGEKLKIDIYLGEMQGYITFIDAQKAQYDVYRTATDAETAKITAYTAEIGAYSERVKAYSVEVGALTDINKIQLENERLRLDSYTNKLQAYQTQVQAEATRIKSETDAYVAIVQAYSSKVGAYSKEFEAGLAQFDGALKENVSLVDAELKQANINITKVIEENKLLIAVTEAGAQVSAEIAAAALTAINVSAGADISGGETTLHTYNYEV